MTEQFELKINKEGKADIIDWVESKEKNAICIYNDLGVLPFSSAPAICDLLNKQQTQINELEQFKNKVFYKINKTINECEKGEKEVFSKEELTRLEFLRHSLILLKSDFERW